MLTTHPRVDVLDPDTVRVQSLIRLWPLASGGAGARTHARLGDLALLGDQVEQALNRVAPHDALTRLATLEDACDRAGVSTLDVAVSFQTAQIVTRR